MKKIIEYYAESNLIRKTTQSIKWRTLIVLVAVIGIILVNDYIQTKYSGISITYNNEVIAFADKYMDGFVTGTIFGIILVSLMLELEYVRGLKKAVELIDSSKKSLRNKKKKK